MEKTHTGAGNGFLRFLKGILYLVIAVLMLSSVLLIADPCCSETGFRETSIGSLRRQRPKP